MVAIDVVAQPFRRALGIVFATGAMWPLGVALLATCAPDVLPLGVGVPYVAPLLGVPVPESLEGVDE